MKIFTNILYLIPTSFFLLIVYSLFFTSPTNAAGCSYTLHSNNVQSISSAISFEFQGDPGTYEFRAVITDPQQSTDYPAGQLPLDFTVNTNPQLVNVNIQDLHFPQRNYDGWIINVTITTLQAAEPCSTTGNRTVVIGTNAAVGSCSTSYDNRQSSNELSVSATGLSDDGSDINVFVGDLPWDIAQHHHGTTYNLSAPIINYGDRQFGNHTLIPAGTYQVTIRGSGGVLNCGEITILDWSQHDSGHTPGKNPCTDVCHTAFGDISTNITQFASNFLTIALGVAGGFALILLVYGSIRVLTSSGNPQSVAAGRDIIIAAIAGLLFLIFSILILRAIGLLANITFL